ncbi:unnamed protein product [Bursaphelenchus okinawaensis]|uniref:Uncharacterized protein n=1 Tax=Bursaphelenchus okinawaensis TaxID=465554 RepID=A0A811JVS6_9BILA|nr:unnamed protein product [Bursaphelenchus okinawaensis]CAG9085218.1 unnamed protein product [Bursaphelenchus okinawaensis]
MVSCLRRNKRDFENIHEEGSVPESDRNSVSTDEKTINRNSTSDMYCFSSSTECETEREFKENTLPESVGACV